MTDETRKTAEAFFGKLTTQLSNTYDPDERGMLYKKLWAQKIQMVREALSDQNGTPASIKKVAERLEVSVQAIYKWIHLKGEPRYSNKLEINRILFKHKNKGR